MYFYSFVMENPDGIDWSIEFAHKGRFGDEEFRDLCEKALLMYCSKIRLVEKGCFRSMEAHAFLSDVMTREFGFIKLEHSSVYGFDPYAGEVLVGSGELKRLVFCDNNKS